MLFPKKHQKNILKLISLFSLIRGYNIFVLILAQYLTAKYILAPHNSWNNLFLDFHFFSVIVASALTTAAGYISNNFYDAAKDQINRPKKYILEHLVSQKIHFFLFFLLNTIALIFAYAVSFYAFLFFIFYILSIWLYSSIIKRLFWLSNLFSALLMILPFWAITLYFKNYEEVIFYLAGYLFFLILARDIVKDLESLKGDWTQRYQSLPVVFDSTKTKWIISIIILLSFIPNYHLFKQPLGLMNYYFILSVPFQTFVLLFLWLATNQKMYLWIHNLIKLWILVGVIGIAFI